MRAACDRGEGWRPTFVEDFDYLVWRDGDDFGVCSGLPEGSIDNYSTNIVNNITSQRARERIRERLK